MADRQLVTRRAQPAGFSQPLGDHAATVSRRHRVARERLGLPTWSAHGAGTPHSRTAGSAGVRGFRDDPRPVPREAAAARRVALVRAQPMSRSAPSSHVRLHQRYRLLVNERRGHRRRRCASSSAVRHASVDRTCRHGRRLSASLLANADEEPRRTWAAVVVIASLAILEGSVFASPSFTSKLGTSHAGGLDKIDGSE
jgi:hypothetical protein